MLKIENITYRVGGRVLFDGASAQVPDGHRVGLVGPNGTGKTTLLRLISGEMSPDAGSIDHGPREFVGTVAQEEPDGTLSPLETVLASDPELAELRAAAEQGAAEQGAAEQGNDHPDIGEIHARLLDLDGHRAEARAARILNGLGFDEETIHRPLSSFSGGWRMRVALAGALFREPDILLLDEPTNHLDLEASMWLETYLSRYPRTLIIVSHDRGFLNRIPTAILHLDGGRLTLYTGGYDRFERARAEKQARQTALYAKQQEQRRHIQSFVDRFRYKASKARQAQSRLKMLEKMEPIASVTDAHTVRFDLPKPDILPPPIITLEDVAVGYDPEKPILKRLNLRVDMDDRIALLGANGNGKTTLLKLLSDRLKPISGKLRRSGKLEVGYFAQNQMEELTGTRTPVEELQALEPMAVEEKLRSHLGRFGFPQGKADTKIASLSGGEKARLALAVICRRSPQLLLLDEPTNHLDIDARQALIQALAAYEGAVILVSHDMHLIETSVDRLLLVEGGTMTRFDGDMADYRRHLLEQRRLRDEKPGNGAPRADAQEDKKADRRTRADARAKLAPLRKAAAGLEEQLEKLTAERARIDVKLADPALYNGDGKTLADLTKSASDLDRAIAKTEDAWLQAQETLERAEQV
ncbi:ABC-F family ATP-binding cassette domain-containing protein [Rhodospirillaceae bacterium KN72]|uniref:ABC-F family ATP-binding cassette domain-containing protein n=1 Tax=Pacificispira spongiicola TaxID=2729598 RepID=A0A7Y0HI47_9PROT|nr:ABC-F family ATP-binding cassette domain-containing protein [Pacificispira spongiicola]NMM46134.1 ABC-F family ATP-binding cassette domain-containing protein [Pacificispira spongiicola]